MSVPTAELRAPAPAARSEPRATPFSTWLTGGRLYVVLTAAAVFVAGRRPAKEIVLPAGVTEIHSEMTIDGGTEVRGIPGRTVLRAASDFHGRAIRRKE